MRLRRTTGNDFICYAGSDGRATAEPETRPQPMRLPRRSSAGRSYSKLHPVARSAAFGLSKPVFAIRGKTDSGFDWRSSATRGSPDVV